MKNFKLTLAAFLMSAILIAPHWAAACDFCAIYMARQIQGQTSQGLHAGVSEQFTHFGTLLDHGHEVPNPVDQYIESSTTQIFLGYNFWEGLGAQVNLPIITRHYQRPNEALLDKGDVSGIGDLSANLNWTLTHQFPNEVQASVKFIGGVKFPTGSPDRIAEELAEHEEEDPPMHPKSGVHGHDLALGTGSYDGVFGSQMYVGWKRIFASGGFQYIARSRGKFNYRYADDFTWNAGPGVYVIANDQCTLAAQAMVSGERKGLDDLNGKPAEDTGIVSVYVGPQVTFTWAKWMSMEAGAELPVVQDNTDFQIVPDYRLHLGLTFFIPGA